MEELAYKLNILIYMGILERFKVNLLYNDEYLYNYYNKLFCLLYISTSSIKNTFLIRQKKSNKFNRS